MLGRAANCTIECACDVLDKNRTDALITIDMADFSLRSCHSISVRVLIAATGTLPDTT
jgi:hypothetical protein